jgi:hypothetical protein
VNIEVSLPATNKRSEKESKEPVVLCYSDWKVQVCEEHVMILFLRSLVGLVPVLWSALVIPSVAGAQGKVENPTYSRWSKFKAGSVVKFKATNKITIKGHETTGESELTMTLIKVTDEKVVVEFEGQEPKTPSTREEYPRMIAFKPGQKKENVSKPTTVF